MQTLNYSKIYNPVTRVDASSIIVKFGVLGFLGMLPLLEPLGHGTRTKDDATLLMEITVEGSSLRQQLSLGVFELSLPELLSIGHGGGAFVTQPCEE